MPLSRILTNTYIDKQNNIVSIGTTTPRANVGLSPTGNAALRISASSTQTMFVANNGNTLITMGTSNTSMGSSILTIQDVTSVNSNVIFAMSRSKVSGANAAIRFGPNYAVSDGNGTSEYAQRGNLYNPVMEMNADTGKITMWADSGTPTDTLYRTPSRREGLTMNYNGQITKPNNPSFYAYIGGANPSHGTGVKTLPMDTVWYDLGVSSGYNNSTYRFTCQVAGTYMFVWGINSYNNPGLWYSYLSISTGNSIMGQRLTSSASGDNVVNQTALVKMAVGDWCEIKWSSANSGNYSSGVAWNYFAGTLIG